MSDIVKDIREAIESEIMLELGAGWKELSHKFDLEKNNFSNSSQRWGVQQLDGVPANGILKFYTVNRIFRITFVQGFKAVLTNDNKQQEAIDILEDAIDRVLVRLINTKGGIPATIQNIVLSNIAEPDFSIEHVTFMELDIIINYKRRLAD